MPDETRGDEVFACVVLEEAVTASEELAIEILEQARETLAYYKLPGYVAFLDALPLTASNKPQRAELKRVARNIVGSIESHSACFDIRGRKKKNA